MVQGKVRLLWIGIVRENLVEKIVKLTLKQGIYQEGELYPGKEKRDMGISMAYKCRNNED